MKKFLVLFMVTLLLSCTSDNESLHVVSPIDLKVENEYAKSKQATISHNQMLERAFSLLKYHPIKSDVDITKDNTKIDECISLFYDANSSLLLGADTRAKVDEQIIKEELKAQLLENRYLFNNQHRNTRGGTGVEYPKYLILFYDDFFKSDSLNAQTLDLEIKSSMGKVLETYPNLTEEEIKKLTFVAGVTYNSCLYWNENSDKWVEVLSGSPYHNTRAHWLWEGVKNGTKKWAKADSSGAISAVAATRTWMGALAGAAVGSLVGAWENLPMWD